MMAMNSHNSTTIQITVLDINDNYPMFTDQYYNRSINETTSVGSTILTVTAPDNDVVNILCTSLNSFILHVFVFT